MSVVPLSTLDLGIASMLVVALAALSVRIQLGIARQLLVAGFRTAAQLFLIGLVLSSLFANAHLGWVLLMAGIMLAIAGYEVMRRQQRSFGGWWGYGLGTVSMFVSAFAITVFVLLVIIGNHPWYAPQYAIPLLGMILGNTMTGVALTLDRLTRNAWEQRNVIEARLILGDSWSIAIGGILRDSIRVGLTPTINAMAAAGVVSLPGMMTGQILGGTPPIEAVKYQILIMFMITGGTGFASMAAAWWGARRLFDERQRLRLDRLHGEAD